MDTIQCRSIYGNLVEVPRDKLVFRIGVYAIMEEGGKVMLLTNLSSGKFAFPGGGVELGEPMEMALKREVREETGLEIEILRFAGLREDLFYYDPKDEAFHGLLVYYQCTPRGEIPQGFEPQDDESSKPAWVDWMLCKKEEFQSPEEYDLLREVFQRKV